jgi:glycolate oxidase FAD binding subunit
MTQDSLLSDLQSIVGPDYAYSPTDDYVKIDGMAPSAVVKPGSYEEVAEVLRFANDRRLAVIPLGAGTSIRIGNIPLRYDIALMLSRLNAVIEHEPADLTITCQAGASLEIINKVLRRSGQMTPFGPWSEEATLGGLVAADENQLDLVYGGPRDFTIGMRVATADGNVIRAGGNVVKNVAGYDLCKLFVGSRGSLGVLVEVTLKLAPSPAVHERSDLRFASLIQACEAARALHQEGLSIQEVTVLRSSANFGEERPEPILQVSLSGSAAAVGRSRREVHRLAPQPDNHEDHSLAWNPNPRQLVFNASVLPAVVPRLVDALDQVKREASLEIIDPIQGRLRAVWLGADEEGLIMRLRAIVQSMDGTLVIEGCSPETKRRIDVFGEVPPKTLDLMRRIKHQFDPNGILSPGRFVGKL